MPIDIGGTYIAVLKNSVLFCCIHVSFQLLSFIFAIGWIVYLTDYIIRIKIKSREHPTLRYNGVTIAAIILLALIGLSITSFDVYYLVDTLM